MILKRCILCNKEFLPKQTANKYCSSICGYKSISLKNTNRKTNETCQICGDKFYAKQLCNKHYMEQLNDVHKEERHINKNCLACGSENLKEDNLNRHYNYCSNCISDKISFKHLGVKRPNMVGKCSHQKGIKLSKERCLKISLGKRGKKRKSFSIEWRRKLGLVSKGKPKSYAHKLKNSLAHKGKIPNSFNKKIIYNNQFFRSNWEKNFAIYCDDNNIVWRYEPKCFALLDKDNIINYFPDFYLPQQKMWVEIKGYWDEYSKLKVKLFIEQIKEPLWIIDASNYNILDKKWKNTLYNPTREEYLLAEGNSI